LEYVRASSVFVERNHVHNVNRCLDCEWRTGFADISITPRLLEKIVGIKVDKRSSTIRRE